MKTVFRTFPGGDVIALFPREPASAESYAYCLSYQRVGQHGQASPDLPNTRPSTPDEIAPLRAELECMGYEVDVAQRITRADHAARREAWNKSIGRQLAVN